MNKKIILLTVCALMLSLFAACGNTAASSASESASETSSAVSAPAETSGPSSSDTEEQTFSLEELAAYNGKNGQPAYVAVDGVVYNVTNVPEWKDGEHKAGLTAGKDLTDEITNQSPHGLRVLDNLPVVGKLA